MGIEHEILNNSILSRTAAGNLLIFLRAHPGFASRFWALPAMIKNKKKKLVASELGGPKVG